MQISISRETQPKGDETLSSLEQRSEQTLAMWQRTLPLPLYEQQDHELIRRRILRTNLWDAQCHRVWTHVTKGGTTREQDKVEGMATMGNVSRLFKTVCLIIHPFGPWLTSALREQMTRLWNGQHNLHCRVCGTSTAIATWCAFSLCI